MTEGVVGVKGDDGREGSEVVLDGYGRVSRRRLWLLDSLREDF